MNISDAHWVHNQPKGSKEFISKLVFHRGYHDNRDDIEIRPLENTKLAYKECIERGFLKGECDVQISKDKVLFLCHDENLKRLANNPNQKNTDSNVHELTWKEIQEIELKDGQFCTSLKEMFDYLQGTKFQMVVELKAGENYGVELSQFFINNPKYLKNVCLFISFDWNLLQIFRNEMKKQSALQNDEKKIPFLGLLDDVVYNDKSFYKYFTIDSPDAEKDLEQFNHDFNFDGFYLPFQEHYLFPEKREIIQSLCEKYTIGMWKIGEDSIACVEVLGKLGISYINTDYPDSFFNIERSQVLQAEECC